MISDDGLKELTKLKGHRNLHVNFSAVTDTGVAHLKRIKSLKDLSGKTLGVQQGGASFQVLPELEAELKKTGSKLGNIVQYGAFSEAYQDLVNRRLDAGGKWW